MAISYAHGPSDAQVVELSDRLRSEGVDCEVDAYDDAPPQGWGRWMTEMMTTRTVLVIASERYYRRFTLQDAPGVGLGATFESGLLVQRAVEEQGSNVAIIPVLLKASDEKFIPEFLRGVARYDLSRPDGYEKLYRRLTDQPAHPRPPLGSIKPLGPVPSSRRPMPRFALIQPHGGSALVFRLSSVDRGKALKLILRPESHADLTRLQALRDERRPMAVAYAQTALFATVRDYRELIDGSDDRVELTLEERQADGGYMDDFSFNGVSADEFALMRARRILLDERPASRSTDRMVDRLNATTFESFLDGSHSTSDRLIVKCSPIPPLAAEYDPRSDEFIEIARLACVTGLVLSGTVERIDRFTLESAEDAVVVDFEGVRRKLFSNVEATRIEVSGRCPLRASSA
ncbi:MAG TPA: TIR domain-containing protein [Candidatus Eremiobacteraceae bacterium]|nr:TIR domain-containing protein [Candidatus Eremiobacteraceae bacterium]